MSSSLDKLIQRKYLKLSSHLRTKYSLRQALDFSVTCHLSNNVFVEKISLLEIIHVIITLSRENTACGVPDLFSSGPSCSKLDRAIKQINYYLVDKATKTY